MFRLISSIGLVMATYAGFALLGPVLGAADFKMALFLANPVWTVPLPSGGAWPVEIGAIFLLLGLTALGIETLTTARAGGRTIGYRALSILWLAGGAALFLLVEGFGTSLFLLLVAMALFDAVAGLLAPVLSSRRHADPADAEVQDGETRGDSPETRSPAARGPAARNPAARSPKECEASQPVTPRSPKSQQSEDPTNMGSAPARARPVLTWRGRWRGISVSRRARWE